MIMKKEAILTILLIVVLFVSSCNSDKNVQQQDSNQPSINSSANDGSPNILIGTDVNSGLDNNNLNNIDDPTLDPNSLG